MHVASDLTAHRRTDVPPVTLTRRDVCAHALRTLCTSTKPWMRHPSFCCASMSLPIPAFMHCSTPMAALKLQPLRL